MSRWPAALLVTASALVLAGCTAATDDKMVPRPARTITATVTPSPTAAPLPASVPVGDADVSPGDAVWAQDNTLHVGKRAVDLSPLAIESLVVVLGGVYFLDRGELWFTDLTEVRGAGITGVTHLVANRDGSAILVEVRSPSGSVATQGYEVRTGEQVPPEDVRAATVTDRLGAVEEVVLRPDRSDVAPSSASPVRARLGPGGFGVVGGDGEPLVVFDEERRQRVPLTGVVGDGFELVRWTGPASIFGLALRDAQPVATLRCDVERRRCTRLGEVDPGRSLVFESGT